MYSKKDFAKALKEKVKNKEDLEAIGSWSHDVYLEYWDVKDADFLNLLLTLNKMELGPEFEFSYKRLDEIADDLIAGKKEINLDY